MTDDDKEYIESRLNRVVDVLERGFTVVSDRLDDIERRLGRLERRWGQNGNGNGQNGRH